jgi:hypothetical protein
MPNPARARDEDDDDLLELPDGPELADLDDEPLGDDELGLSDEEGDEDERIGLDDSAGLDDDASLFALDLPPEEREDSADDADDLIPVEGLDDGDEYGWSDTGNDEDEPWDAADLDLPSLSPLSGEDGGEEGVDEAHDAAGARDDDATGLPPLRPEDGEEGDDELSLGEDALIEEASLGDDEERVHDGAVLPPALDGSACRVEHLGPSEGGPILDVALGLSPMACGAGVFIVRDDRLHRLPAAGLEGLEVMSIAIDPREPSRVLVGTRASGAFRSTDGGASFAPANGWADEDRAVAQPFVVAVEDSPGDALVWGRTASGALFRSADFGASWVGPLLLKPAVAIAPLEGGGLVALCAGRDAPSQIARSQDGGQRWAAVDGPPLPSTHGEPFVAASRDSIAVAVDDDLRGPFLSNDRGKTWTRVPGLPPTGPMALAWEPGGLALYAAHFFDGGDRGVVIRHRPGGGESAVVLDVAREAAERAVEDGGDPEGDHRVHALVAQRDGRRTLLLVATGAGLFRVLVDPDRVS